MDKQRRIGQVIVWLCLGLQGKGEASVEAITCEIHRRSWLAPDLINITWHLPATVNTENLTNNIFWMTTHNQGRCSISTMTSCICNYGDVDCFDFGADFQLRISLYTQHNDTVYENIWDVNGLQCDKPPPVDQVKVRTINGSCLDVGWAYNNVTCTFSSDKIYRLTFTDRLKSSSSYIDIYLPAKDSCSGHYILCGLKPARQYTISMQCRDTDYLDRPSGHWSDITVAMTTTNEDIPTGSPAVTPGGYTIKDNRCMENGTKLARIYWKDVDPEQRNGRIIWYSIETYGVHKQVDADIGSGSTELLLTCNRIYDVFIRAATSIGQSEVFSKMTIPQNEPREMIVTDVIPEMDIYNTTIVTLSWKLRNISSNHVITVFWCLNDGVGQCKSMLNWEILPPFAEEYDVLLEPNHIASSYQYGVTTGNQAIVWTSCLFLKDTGLPFDPKLRDDVSRVANSIGLQWNNPPCESRPIGPFIDMFVVDVCQLMSTKARGKSCGANVRHSLEGHAHSYLLNDLDPDHLYHIRLGFVDLQGQIRMFNGNLTIQPFREESIFESVPHWAIICAFVFGLIVLLTAVVGMVCLYRMVYEYVNKKFFRHHPITDNMPFEIHESEI